jgi:hypothetical protein
MIRKTGEQAVAVRVMHGSVPLFPMFCFRSGDEHLAKRLIAITVSTDQVFRDDPAGMQQTDGSLEYLLYLVDPSHEDTARMCV